MGTPLLLSIFSIGLAGVSFTLDDSGSQGARCFYNKKLEMILVIDAGGEFLFVNNEVLMGTEYLLAERGYVSKGGGKEMTLMIHATANFEADSIDFGIVESLGSPLPVLGDMATKGIQIESKGAFLKECSCHKKVFRVVENLRGFYPSNK